jgi:hypothetical protein
MNLRITKDERFLIKLRELAEKTGDVFSEVNRSVIGKAIGENDHVVNNIIRHLAQANFIKKGEDDMVYITQNGINLVDSLLEQKSNK